MLKLILVKQLSWRQRRNKVAWVIGLLIILAYSVFVNPVESKIATCQFSELTGLDCPTCGISRSFYSVSHFRLNEAFDYHPLGPVLFIIFILLLIHFLFELILKKDIQITKGIINIRWLLGAFIGLWFMVWILKIL